MRCHSLCASLLLLSCTVACTSPSDGTNDETEGGASSSDAGNSSTDAQATDGGDSDGGTMADESSTGTTGQCGDGVVDDLEECEPGDPDVPCTSDCRSRARERWFTALDGRGYNAVGVDASGNVYAAGFMPTRFADDLLVDAYGPDGEQLWSYTRGRETDDEVATDLAVLPSGEVAVVGIGHLHRFAFSETIEVIKLDAELGELTDLRILPKLADHSVPERARVAAAPNGSMVVTYNESGQGSLAGLNYVFYDAAGDWLQHEVREDDRSIVADVAAGPGGEYVMLHWYDEPPLGGFTPQIEVYDEGGTRVEVVPLLAEGGYALDDAAGIAIAPDGTLRIPALSNVVALDGVFASVWSTRFHETNAYWTSTARVADGGETVFAGTEVNAGTSFVAAVSASGETEWFVPLPDGGARAIDLWGEQAAIVGQSIDDDALYTWIRTFDVRFDPAP